MKRIIFIFISFIVAIQGFSNTRITRTEYIDKWKDEAIYQMVVNKIPASITLAQGILESGDGNSELASVHNNHFGIKCHGSWDGAKTYHDDDKRGECFRAYPDAHLSFDDHSDFLLKKRYESLFELKITDYKGWAKGLKKYGYATHPKYASRLIGIIEAHNLTVFDAIGEKMIKKGKVPPRKFDLSEDEVLAQNQMKSSKKSHKKHDDDLPNVSIELNRTLKLSANNVKYILSREGDTFQSIAKDLEMRTWQIRKYNDFKRDDTLSEGQIVYLQPKRNMAREKDHIVVEGETMWDISQRYGVKLTALYKKNNMPSGTEPDVGQRLYLRTKTPVKF